jgi:hypothetical protein
MLIGMQNLTSAQAQITEAPGTETPSTAAPYRQVWKTCKHDLEKLCSDLTQSPYAARNQAMCLKPYMTTLSLQCRSTIKAIFP